MHLKNISARFELPVTETLPPGQTGEREGLKLLARFGIPTVAPHIMTTAAEAAASAEDFAHSIVLKGLVEGVAHKAAVGLVRLGLETPSDVATS